MIGILLWVGCTNRAPVLESVNGQAAKDTLLGGEYVPSFEIRGGEILELQVEARDPDGDPVEIRFSDMPGIVTFDPFGTTGTLEVFDQVSDTPEFQLADAVILLLDDHDPPAWAENQLFFYYEREETDTGEGVEHPAR